MTPYLFLFFVPAFFAIKQWRPIIANSRRWGHQWWLVFIVVSLFVGLRHEVGADWFNYLDQIDRAAEYSFLDVIVLGDPAYKMLNWFGAIFGGSYFVNVVCAMVIAWGLIEFCRLQPRAWLALAVAVPYLVIVVGMGYTRQGAAIGFALLALVGLTNGRLARFAYFIALAGAFHKSAVILMPLAALVVSRNKILSFLFVALFSIVLYLLFLQESVDKLKYIYLEREYESSGAAIRIFMNAIPAVIFMRYRRRFGLLYDEERFWLWMALISLFFVVLLMVSPSSTAVDRVALYLIPLQLVVFSRLPEVFGKLSGRGNGFWVCSVVAYSGLVLIVWLSFADHASAWLPYQFYPWVWLWK